MTVYYTLWQDRHTDPEVKIFAEWTDAFAYFTKIVDAYREGGSEVEIDDSMKGLERYARLTGESDRIELLVGKVLP